MISVLLVAFHVTYRPAWSGTSAGILTMLDFIPGGVQWYYENQRRSRPFLTTL
jgi:hypothetical protein